jgi:hypothetical protein
VSVDYMPATLEHRITEALAQSKFFDQDGPSGDAMVRCACEHVEQAATLPEAVAAWKEHAREASMRWGHSMRLPGGDPS